MYKILVLKNRIDVPVEDDFTKAVDYFKSKGINVCFEYKEIDVPVSVHYYLVGTDGGRYYGIDDYVKDSCDKYVEKGKYHTVVFTWNTKDVPAPTDGQITSWSNWSPLSWQKADTEFIQLITNDYNDKSDWIYKSIIHEIMHSFCKRIQRRGLYVIDEMDITIDGKPYFKNSEPDAIDGNFARTFNNLKPHMGKLYDFYFIDQEKPQFKTLSLGMYGASQLQKDLKTLGYFTYPFVTGFFGLITKKAVVAFQKANGIIQTGNYGPITHKALQEALKKKSNLDLLSKKDFGLLPEVQSKANLLIEMAGTVGMDIRITEGYRSPERQNELYAQGRTTPGKIVTWAKAGESYHQSRKAFDVCFKGSDPYPNDDTKWKRLADIGQSIGLKAGYYFPQDKKDSPHFEVS
jgi:hypothetical protein